MSVQLRGGFTTEDRRLDALPEFDERSREYPAAAVIPSEIKGRTWWIRTWLDQGSEGACVGFSWSHELASSPSPHRNLTNSYAQALYKEAQRIDEWAGEDYEGTSVLAGAKVVKSRGWISEYRWAFSIDEALRAISTAGPVVFGIPWLDSMSDPRPSGLLDCSGTEDGRHAILGRGLSLKPQLRGESNVGPVVRLHNSWGRNWGYDGDAYIKVDDLEKLLIGGRGECCVPMGRTR